MPSLKHNALLALTVASFAQFLVPASAHADDWWKDVKFSGYVEGGGVANIDRGSAGSRLNWGSLFTDRFDHLDLNQASLIVSRDIDSKKDYDVGFKLQGMYGSDARYTHFLGEFDHSTSNRDQFDIVEAWLNFHTPWLGKGGTDIKVGQYVTLEGAETIDPRTNLFYSHSYIFNFGIPLKHTGVLATTHVNDMLDLYYGIDTGVNTTFGAGTGDSNNSEAFHGGFGLTLMGGDLTVLATTHIGDELPTQGPFGFSSARVDTRYLNDVTIVYKATKQLTLTADINYIRDDSKVFGANGNSTADGGGVALYAAYQYTDNLAFGLRGEWFRDSQGAFVAAFPGTQDFVNAELGNRNTSIVSPPLGKGTDYYAITAGATISPTVSKMFDGLKIRPEIRWDHSTDTTPFKGGASGLSLGSHDEFTIGTDVIIPFALN